MPAVPRPFDKVLIANRGEIAVRVARSLREMGIAVAAVYSDPDADALHVEAADEAHRLAGESSVDTYLRGDRVLDIARACGADAIHPGYGFLSENADFARACADGGVAFIGPTPEAIMAMGDKVEAKRRMETAHVPVVPGWTGDAEAPFADAERAAQSIGAPLLVKAAAGGGGKGMRVVHDLADLRAAWDAAQREAGAAFGDARVFLEKYIPRARHVEFQIFGDAHGNAVHLFERECSIQRRHQKIIEEAPSPALTPDLRERMGAAAVAAARAIGYRNAGTVEFLLDDDGSFYFLEVNTRLQVEHPVTEETILADLVRAQVLVAAGEKLPFDPAALRQHGHAVECRVYAEDGARNFMPSTGTILHWETPDGPGIRVDTGVRTGSEVSVHYDPMLAKIIARGADRTEAVARMAGILRQTVVLGVTTNIPFLLGVLEHPAFRAGDLSTRFLDDHAIDAAPPPATDAALLIAALAADAPESRAAPVAAGVIPSPWRDLGHWRNGA